MADHTAAEIEELVRRFPLPEGVNDVVLNRAELAEFLKTTPNTISQWLKDGMPVLREGTNGTSYEFQASHCYAWKQDRDSQEQVARTAAQEAIAAMRLHLTGGKDGDSIEALPPRERREIYELQAAQEKWKRERNITLPREDVEMMLESILRFFRDGVTSFADMMERRAKLSPDQTEILLGGSDDLLEETAKMIQQYFDDRPVNNDPERTTLFQ